MLVSKEIHFHITTCKYLVSYMGYELNVMRGVQFPCMVSLWARLQPPKDSIFSELNLLEEGKSCLTGGEFV